MAAFGMGARYAKDESLELGENFGGGSSKQMLRVTSPSTKIFGKAGFALSECGSMMSAENHGSIG